MSSLPDGPIDPIHPEEHTRTRTRGAVSIGAYSDLFPSRESHKQRFLRLPLPSPSPPLPRSGNTTRICFRGITDLEHQARVHLDRRFISDMPRPEMQARDSRAPAHVCIRRARAATRIEIYNISRYNCTSALARPGYHSVIYVVSRPDGGLC